MKIKLLLLLAFLPFLGNGQIIHNIGFGFGSNKVAPKLFVDEDGGQSFVGGRDIQLLNLSYEPRLILLDSIANQFSLSIGTPVTLGLSFFSDDKTTETIGYGSAQVACIGYFNWGNGSLRNNFYNRKLGLSIGFGLSYLHTSIIEKEIEGIRPKNDLTRPVISYSIRYKNAQDIILEFNFLWTFRRTHYYEECRPPTGFELYPFCWKVGYEESGLLVQAKLFFGQ